jgi:TPP-dependent pyruvate/acetoin dehydrogenase alpha subunit
VMFICENNGYAIHTPQSKRQGVPDIAQRAKAFGVTTTLIEDNNALKLHEATNQAVSDIRSGEATGPYLFECRTYRWKEHVGPGEDWHLGFRTLDEAQPWVQNDQVGRIGELISTEARTAIEAEVEAELENSPFPEEAELFTDVYSTPNAPLEARKAA